MEDPNQLTIQCMGPEGAEVPGGDQEDVPSWGKESLDLVEVAIADNIPPDLELLVSRWSHESHTFMDD